MRAERLAALRRATLARIGECGDMNIRVRSSTLAALIRAAGHGLPEMLDHSEFREVDAVALEALVILAGRGAQ